MKKSTRGALGLLIASGMNAEAEASASLPTDRRIQAAYGAYAASPSDLAAQSAYLEAFPDDYATFESLFTEGSAPLREGSGDYIRALARIGRNLPDATLCKILKIDSFAHWDGEGLDALQEVTLKLALAHPKAFVGALECLRPAERRGLATFLADGPDGPREEALGLAAKLEVAGQTPFATLLRQEAELSEGRSGGDSFG